MKKLFISLVNLSLVLLISSLSCTYSAASSSIAKKEFTVDPFTKLEIGGPFNVFIRQGETEQVYIEADEKVLNRVRVNSEGQTLVVNVESFDFRIKKLDVYITLKNVNCMKFYDAGNVECKGVLKFDNLKIDYARTGNMSLNLECNQLDLDSRGTGNVELSGAVKKAMIDHSGTGNFDAENFKVEILKVKCTGTGNKSVYASKEIYLNVAGIGNFEYAGEAVVKEYKYTGVGNINKK